MINTPIPGLVAWYYDATGQIVELSQHITVTPEVARHDVRYCAKTIPVTYKDNDNLFAGQFGFAEIGLRFDTYFKPELMNYSATIKRVNFSPSAVANLFRYKSNVAYFCETPNLPKQLAPYYDFKGVIFKTAGTYTFYVYYQTHFGARTEYVPLQVTITDNR